MAGRRRIASTKKNVGPEGYVRPGVTGGRSATRYRGNEGVSGYYSGLGFGAGESIDGFRKLGSNDVKYELSDGGSGHGGTAKIYLSTGLNAGKFKGFDGALGSLYDYTETENEDEGSTEEDYDDGQQLSGSREGSRLKTVKNVGPVRSHSESGSDPGRNEEFDGERGSSAGYTESELNNEDGRKESTGGYAKSRSKIKSGSGSKIKSNIDSKNKGSTRDKDESGSRSVKIQRPESNTSGYEGSDDGHRESNNDQNGRRSHSERQGFSMHRTRQTKVYGQSGSNGGRCICSEDNHQESGSGSGSITMRYKGSNGKEYRTSSDEEPTSG